MHFHDHIKLYIVSALEESIKNEGFLYGLGYFFLFFLLDLWVS